MENKINLTADPIETATDTASPALAAEEAGIKLTGDELDKVAAGVFGGTKMMCPVCGCVQRFNWIVLRGKYCCEVCGCFVNKR